VSATDFVTYSITAPVDRGSNRADRSSTACSRSKPDKASAVDNITTFAASYGKQ
jgi:hypothetical protein